MSKPTEAEYNGHIAALNAKHCLCADKLRADVERLEKEWDELSVLLQEEGERGGTALMKRNTARTQLGEAEKRLHLSKCIGQNPDSNADYYCWMHGGPKAGDCPRCTFLAGLCTVTEEDSE